MVMLYEPLDQLGGGLPMANGTHTNGIEATKMQVMGTAFRARRLKVIVLGAGYELLLSGPKGQNFSLTDIQCLRHPVCSRHHDQDERH